MRRLRRTLGFSVRRRRFKRGYRYRNRRRSSATRTRIVKFQTQIAFNLQSGGVALPVTFSPTQLPGFLDWQTTMSEFRFLKAKLKILINPGATTGGEVADQNFTFLRASSRPFVTSRAIDVQAGSAVVGVENIALGQAISATINQVRQTKFTKQMYPADNRNVIVTSFYPYTMQWSGKVYNSAAVNITSTNMQYLEYRSARRWMSMSFLGSTNAVTDDVTYFGPYFLRLQSNLPDTQTLADWSPVCLLTVYAQFRGQR